jgi:DNA polymerase-4
MAILHSYTPLVEPLSLDEADLDVTETGAWGATPAALAQEIKARVRAEVGLTISIGVGTSKGVAKIASGLKKPDGLVVVEAGREAEFLAPLPVGKLWGIGPKTEERLAAEGIRTIGGLAAQEEAWFLRTFGKRAGDLRQMAVGEDSHPVTPGRITKSVSAEVTLPRDTGEAAALKGLLEELVARVEERLAAEGLRGRTVTLKLRTSDFCTFTRSVTLPAAARSQSTRKEVAWELLRGEIQPGLRFRLVGVSVSNFIEERELPLFGEGAGVVAREISEPPLPLHAPGEAG